MGKKFFGTDGIRGKVGEYPITPEFMMKLGWAAGTVFRDAGQSTILIGKDTRISGYMFESALEAGLSAAGVDVMLLGPMTTPGIAYLTRTFHAQAGIVISASHNPFHDNGIKFFSKDGKKLPDDVELAIEEQLEKTMAVVDSDRLGKAFRLEDARGRYIEFCKSTIPRSIDLRGVNVVLDCANGATYHVAPAVFTELGANVTTIGTDPNGLNINLDVGSTSPAALQKAVVEKRADFGIAFDGDGDRVLMVDHNGEVVDGDELIYIIARGLHEAGNLKGGIVGTLMSNYGMELALKDLGIDFVRAKVGDRYVMAELNARGWLVGGESSGHILCLDRASTGDGIVSALQVLTILVRSGKTLADLKKGMKKLPQTMINVRLPAPGDPSNNPTILKAVASVTEKLEGKGRVLLRPSGTEPVVRVMIEGEDPKYVQLLCEELSEVVRSIVNQSQ